MKPGGVYKRYHHCDAAGIPRRSAHRYKKQYAASLADGMPAENFISAVCSPSYEFQEMQRGEIQHTAVFDGKGAATISSVENPSATPPQLAGVLDPPEMESIEQDPMAQPLFPGAQLNHHESLVLIMAHCLRHHNSKEATESLLALLHSHLPKGSHLPATKYMFDKYFKNQEQEVSSHFYCPTCHKYIGVAEGGELLCACGLKHSAKVLLKEGSYFLSLDWRSELANLLKARGPLVEKPGLKFDVGDITESPAYCQLPLCPDDVTLTWNTDGIPIFHSSDYSVWPLELMVNELPLKERMNNVLLAGLWFGPKKPDMQCFLIPFVQEMNELSSTGLSWSDKNNVSHLTKVYSGPCTVDTVARCMLHNQKQFNGEYGCSWCFHPGRVVKQGRGHARVYETMKVKNRTDNDFIRDARSLSHGVLGTTVLSLMRFFSITNNTVVDYMHAVCLGVVRTTTNLWLTGVHSGKGFYLGRKLSALNDRLKGLTPPYEFARLPRSLCQRKFWKATEWRAWLLYYSPFVLNGLLPLQYFKNWCRLGNIMHVLLADTVALDNLAAVEAEIVVFMSEYQHLYGFQHMTFNIHLLSHLCDSVRQWGPLWGFSAFPFENMNGIVKKSFHGTQYIPQQICRQLLLSQFLPTFASTHMSFDGKPEIFHQFENLTRGYRKIFNVHKERNAMTIGAGSKTLTMTEADSIKRMGFSTSCVMKFKKVLVKGTKFISSSLNKSSRNNSVVYLNDGSFGIIECVLAICAKCTVLCRCEKDVYFLLQDVRAKLSKFTSNFARMHLLETQQHYKLVNVGAVSNKCVAFIVNDKLYACPLFWNMDH